MASPFQGDDQDDFEAARDKEGNVKQTGLSPTAKLSSFGAAFNAARRGGEKTFTWKGKKYTTEMAKDKPKAAPKAAPKASKADEEPMTRAEFDKAEAEDRLAEAKKASNTYASQQGYFGSFKKGGEVKQKPAGVTKSEVKKTVKREVKRHEKTMHGMKKGGTVRGDGIAQRGKTKGRMV